MKNLSFFIILFTLTSCSPKNLIKFVRGPENRTQISAKTHEARYQNLWDAVEKDRALPKLVAHIGASTPTETAIWMLTEDRILMPQERNWMINCGAGPQPKISEAIYDPIFRVSQQHLQHPCLCD